MLTAQRSRFPQASPDKFQPIFSFGVGLVQGNDHRRDELCLRRLRKSEPSALANDALGRISTMTEQNEIYTVTGIEYFCLIPVHHKIRHLTFTRCQLHMA